jgi:tetratricopeptide (TPR) repeat protein
LDRLESRLRETAPTDPRVVAISVSDLGSEEERLQALRAAMPLDSEDPFVKREAWLTLLGEMEGMSGSTFRRVASEALTTMPGELLVGSQILYDPRTWEDRELARRTIDHVKELRAEGSTEQLLAEANWILAFDRGNEAARVEAISLLNAELLSSPDSYAIGATLLRLMIADATTDPQSAIRLGKRLLADRPDAVEIYPLVIELMQAQGMLADADRLLQEFESIDSDGRVSARQRAASSLRQGNLESLVRSLADLSTRSGQGSDAISLGRARAAVGDLVGAEQAFRSAMADESVRGEAILRLGVVLQRAGRVSEFEALLESAGSELSQLQLALALAEVQVAEGNAADAVLKLQQAASALGNESLYWRGLAVSMLAAGDRAAAAEASIKGLRLDPLSEDLVSIVITAAVEDPSVLERIAASAAVGPTPDVVVEAVRVLRASRDDAGRLSPDMNDLRAARELCSRFADAQGAWRVATALHQVAGQPGEAMALATAAARRFPDSPDPVQWQVFAASSLGELDKASALCAEWRRLRFPDVRPVDEAHAALELARNRPESALVLLNRHRDLIVDQAAVRPGPYRALLASLILTGQVRDAARLEQSNLVRSESSGSTWAEIATMAPYDVGLEAMSILEAASISDAGQRARMIGRWVAFHARHPEGRAIDRARALLPRNLGEPRDYDSRIAIVARADIERALGDVAAAVRSLRSVLDSFSPDVQSRAAAIGTLTGQAQQDLFREIEPLLYARNNLSMLLLEQGTSLDEALGLVEQCLAIIPGSPELRDTHAQVLLKLGRVSEAEQSSVFAIQRLPTNASVILTGCEILLASGRVEDSRLLVQRVREILAREPWPSREVEDRLRRVASQIDS